MKDVTSCGSETKLGADADADADGAGGGAWATDEACGGVDEADAGSDGGVVHAAAAGIKRLAESV